MSRTRRRFVAAALAVVGWLGVSYVALLRITARPHEPYAEHAPAVDFGALVDVRLVASDGVATNAWWSERAGDGPSVVLLHGYKGDRGVLVPKAAIWARAGASPLLVTLRAHGDSQGDSNDFGWSARLDVEAAVRFVESRRPHAPIVVCGASLGAAAAAFAAPTLGERVRTFVLECPYSDIWTAARSRCRRALRAPFDAVAYTGLAIVAPLRFDSLASMDVGAALARGSPTSAVVVLGGSRDVLAPLEEQRAIVERVGPRARLVVLDTEHDRLVGDDPAGYEREVRAVVSAPSPR